MSSTIRTHIRGNIVGYVAVFIALSGTAYAVDGPLAGQNTVGSQDIINGEVITDDISDANGVRSADVRNDTLNNGGLQAIDLRADSVGTSEVDGSLTGGDLADDGSIGTAEIDEAGLFNDDSLTGADIAPESLSSGDITNLGGGDIANSSLTGTDLADNLVTGADINESTLGTVPNAAEVDGLGARSFEFHGDDNAATTTVLNQGGLALKADCENNRGTSQVKLFADSQLNDSHLLAVDDPIISSADPTLDSDFDSAEANHQLILQEGGNIIETGMGIVTFRGGPAGGTDTTSDDVVTVQYSYLADSSARCTLFGTAIGGPS